MADLKKLVREAPFGFVGTVEHMGATTMEGIPADERTAVVHVDSVIVAPEAFVSMAGQIVTLQLSPDIDPPAEGETAAFFAEGLAFGETIALSEVGRASLEEVEPQFLAAGAAEGGAAAGFTEIQQEVEADKVREHAAEADAVVAGRVMGLVKAADVAAVEHDPDWWIATIHVVIVERGDVSLGDVQVLYANSLDVRWRTAPKPKASQGGLWLLHATPAELSAAAAWQILHPEDFQPTQMLDAIRGGAA